MKKSLFLLAILPVMLFTFSACSDDDDEINGLTEEYICGGTWYVSEIEMDGKWEDMSSIGMRVTFKEDGSYTLGYGQYLDVKYYKGTWTLKGNTINGITVDGIKEYFKFKSINNNDVVIEYTNSDEINTPLKCKATKK